MEEKSLFNKFIEKVKDFLTDEDYFPNWLIILFVIFFISSCFTVLSLEVEKAEYEKIIKEDYGIIFDNYTEYKNLKNTYKK